MLPVLRPDSAPCAAAATPVLHIRRPDKQFFIQREKPPRVHFSHEDIHAVSKEIKQVRPAETDNFAHFESPSNDSRVIRRSAGQAPARKRARSRIAAAGPDPPCGENAVASLSSLMHNSCQVMDFKISCLITIYCVQDYFLLLFFFTNSSQTVKIFVIRQPPECGTERCRVFM